MDDFIRKLQIGFMDSIDIEHRNKLICSGTGVPEVLKMYPNEEDHYDESLETYEWLNKGKGSIIWYGSENYPDFRPIERKIPYFLMYKGKFPEKDSDMISIVGTRNVDNDGFQSSFRFGLECAANGIAVVSGLAEGCDQASLNGAVSGNFASFGVLGCGLEYDYPKYSEKLKSRMIELSGGIISRFSPNCPPLKYNFPNRNLIISALGLSTIVVQAPKKSGSLITADMTLQLGKDVYISEAGIGNQWSRYGSNMLAEDGAPVLKSVNDICECKYSVEETDNPQDIRFGNKHYFLRTLK